MAASGITTVDALLGDGTMRVNFGELPGTAAVVTYSFMETQPAYSQSGWTAIGGFGTFSEVMRQAVREVLGLYSAAATVEFVEVSDAGAGGALRFGTYATSAQVSSPGVLGYSFLPTGSGTALESDVWLANTVAANLTPVRGSDGFYTLMHEVGHALGFKHPAPYDGDDEPPFLTGADDVSTNTVMSYNGPTTASLGPLDVQAAGWLYGPRSAGTIGTLTAGGDGGETLYAAAGGGFLQGRGGNDVLIGSDGGDGLVGGANEDLLIGGAGADTLLGGDGFDTLGGGEGDDRLNGNQHADQVYGEGGADIVRGGKGEDAVYGNAGNDSVYGDLGRDTVYGGQGNDVLYGGKDEDLLFGDAGNDTLLGDLAADTLTGGAGGDVFVLRSDGGGDVVTDFSAAEGDRIGISGGWTAAATAEGVRVTSTAGDGWLLLRGVNDLSYSSVTWWW